MITANLQTARDWWYDFRVPSYCAKQLHTVTLGDGRIYYRGAVIDLRNKCKRCRAANRNRGDFRRLLGVPSIGGIPCQRCGNPFVYYSRQPRQIERATGKRITCLHFWFNAGAIQ